jgi:putative tricarboxylic transport membrane protein
VRKADRISGTFLLLLSIVISLESYHAGLGTLRRPGPGFLFFGAGILLGLLSFIVLLRAFSTQKTGEHEKSMFGQVNIAKISLVMGSLLAYALVMEPLGFIPATFLMFMFLLGAMEKKGWLFTVLASLVVTFVAYVIFDVWLKSQLPRGVLESLNF